MSKLVYPQNEYIPPQQVPIIENQYQEQNEENQNNNISQIQNSTTNTPSENQNAQPLLPPAPRLHLK